MNLALPLYNLFHLNKQWNENLIFEGRLIIWYAKKLLTFLKTNDTSFEQAIRNNNIFQFRLRMGPFLGPDGLNSGLKTFLGPTHID